MTIFEYFLVLFSMVLSITLTHLASGIGELIRSRKTVTWSLPYCLWLFMIGQTVIDMWSSAWLMRGTAEFRMLVVLLMLSTAMAGYLAAMWVIPHNIGERSIDLYAYMVDQRRYFIGAMLYYVGTAAVWNEFLMPGGFDLANHTITGPTFAILVVAWISPAKAVQHVVPVLGTVAVLAYYVYYFPTIG